MLEMGKFSSDEHKKIVNLVKELKLEHVYFVGNEFRKIKSGSKSNFKFLKNVTELNTYLKKQPAKNNYILLKASRGISLEKAIPYL